MMNNKSKIFSILILLSGMFLCGAIFDKPYLKLDTETNVVYQNYSIDEILDDFAQDSKQFKKDYDKSRIVLWGKVTEKSKNNKDVVLASTKNVSEKTIKCSSSNKNIINEIAQLAEGDIVKVYGKFSIGAIVSDLSMTISKIEKTTVNSASSTCYSVLSGNSVDRKNMAVRHLSKDKIEYYIPTDWADVEYNIIKDNLGSIEGYQYRLNELPDSVAVQPESFFVCYFDNKLLKYTTDINKTDKIERAIISNILNGHNIIKDYPNNLDKLQTKKATTYYGAKYQYYHGSYETQDKKGHHVEFVFQQVGTNGIIVYLYVYNDANSVDDIMFLMRILEVKL